MYSFQFQDATYRIALYTNSKIDYVAIIRNDEAHRLYDGVYSTRLEAENALFQIKKLIGAR